MRAGRRWIAGIAGLFFIVAAAAQMPPEPTTKGDYGNGEDFRLTPIVAKDGAGKPITDIPAFELGFRDTDGAWTEGGPPVPFTGVIPDALRGRVMLVLDGDWSLVPRGWKMSYAMLTSDTTLAVGYEAPGGKASGWMNSGMVVCAGCALEYAAPYFPRSMQDWRADADEDWPRPRAEHSPLHLSRPDGCTVVFDYQMPHSPPVHEWMNYIGVRYGVLLSFEIAMPDADKDLRDLIFADHTSDHQKCVVRQDRVKGKHHGRSRRRSTAA
ncbi:DUF4850 domain-containing protein [Luteibacter sp. dw_328]|uniref:DUF4850 domain-containing protein n=1 Tax=Luteibacter sp. dw_328 TaxID=2719796 RepID=UPI001BD2B443|nr:DUF4850 domain-containing protein [Luteibacter sp. dw_328]